MYKKITYYLLITIIAYIPFYRFFQALLESHTSLSPSLDFWIAHWYEPVILIVLVMNFFIWLFRGKHKALTRDQIIAIALLIFGAISIFFFSPSVGRGLEGFRFLLLPLVIYLSLTFAKLGQYKDKFIKTYLTIAIMMAIWSLIERFFPANYFVEWGILASQDSWYGTQTVVGVKQGIALLGGPNILAAYLLPAFFLLFDRKKIDSFLLRFTLCTLPFVVLAAIILTFSRSALIGLALTLFIMFFFLAKSWKRRLVLIILTIIFGLALLFTFKIGSQKVRDLFTHGASQNSHQSSLQISMNELSQRAESNPTELIFGSGLGSAGPSAMKYGDGIVSESWYLQVLLEIGLFGFALWLAFFWLVLKNVWQRGDKPLFFGLFSILIMTAFLHTLSDNPALSFTLFALMAFLKKEDYARV